MGQKIVFLDIDGTILDHDKQIPPASKDAIAQLQESGIIVSIATGRAPFMIQEILKELNLNTYISFNGQYAVHNGEVIYHNPISDKLLSELTDYSVKEGHPLVYQSVDDMRSSVSDHPHIIESMGSLKLDHPLVDIDYYRNNAIYQVLVFNEAEEQRKYEADFPDLRFVRWHPFSSDVLPGIGSKANGIKECIEALNIDWEDTYAFGDGLNDLEMIQAVHTGVAMGNGVQEVKEVASLVTDDVDQDGLSKAMRKLSLIK
ncbi:Cof-type HAD-IIB family hydrolase [Gracilibacillus caseinilyticus]|uniref:Cof-type HAD-IIB family hydrolase n=1 Tax=Gracilibacillus caseinilyticus TaxID=2932256 RepID=A0ABY4EUB2_9BACI|nr:Cof-type HAD-IIB family hydrolase [Gracilibacillus caseinilyticus]UOQ48009.1 Cof-type HAD-IIB family hydrolase [Gracilibacillus caseinilyticus]